MLARVSIVRSESDGRDLVFGVRIGSGSAKVSLASPEEEMDSASPSTAEPLPAKGALEALTWRLARKSSAGLFGSSDEASVVRLGVLLVKRLVRRCGVETTRVPSGRCAGGRLTLDRSWSRDAAGRNGVDFPSAPETLDLSWPREAVVRSFGLCRSRAPASADEGGRGIDETLAEKPGLGMPDCRGIGSRDSLGVEVPAGRSCEASIVLKVLLSQCHARE